MLAMQFLWARHKATVNESIWEDWFQKESFDHTLLSFHSCSVSKITSLLPVLRFLASHMEMESQRPVCAHAHAHACAYKHKPVFYSKLKRKKKFPRFFNSYKNCSLLFLDLDHWVPWIIKHSKKPSAMNRACSSNWVMLWNPLLFPSLHCWIFFQEW